MCPTKHHRDGHPDLTAYGGRGVYPNLNFIASANPATVLSLLAEIAALRAKVTEIGAVAVSWQETATEQLDARTEAERKLAEAVGLLRECIPWITDYTDLYGRTRTLLSNEAERG